MPDTQTNSLQCFMIIADQKKKDRFLRLLSEFGAHGIETVYGHGSMSPSALAAAFGLDAEQGKVLITCLLRTENAKRLIETLYRDYKFDKPNTGIAFSIPVEGLAF